MTLNFDMTFLFLFLTKYFKEETLKKTFRCPIHPIKQKTAQMNKYAYYSSAMNILLTYHKFEDDWNDDKRHSAKVLKNVLEEKARLAEKEYPKKSEAIKNCLFELSNHEKNEEHNPDIPANCFGRLMAEIFDVYGNDKKLYDFGFSLGKVIYVMDACVDLKEDIKACRYNPMVEIPSGNFQQILTILLSDCTQTYDTMNIENNDGIIENILFSGIWSKFRRTYK